MKTLTQNEVKNNIYKILEMVNNGEDILIKSDHSKKNFAVIIPYNKYKEKKYQQPGI